MSDNLADLSDEWASRNDVAEPEMWGFLATLDAMGATKTEARTAVKEEFGDDP